MWSLLVIDACFAITYGAVGRWDPLTDLSTYRIIIPATALTEVRRPPASTAVRAAIAAGKITVERIDVYDLTEQQALARYDSRTAFGGRGEAEVLALVAARGYTASSDERPVLPAARQEFRSARAASNLGILVRPVGEPRLTLAEAEAWIDQLDIGLGIRKRLAVQRKQLQDLI